METREEGTSGMARQRRSVLAIDADMPTAWGIKGAWNRREVDGLAFAAKRAAITMAPVVEPVFASVFTASAEGAT